MKLLPPPGPQRRRQLGFLAFALVALAVLARYRFGPDTADGPAPSSNSTGPAVSSRPAGPLVLPQPVQLASLEPVPQQPAAGRNPFRFGVPPPPPPPPAPPPPTPTPYVAPPPPAPPPIPPVPLKLTALMTLPDGRRQAWFSDGKGGVFSGFDGDILDGRYKLVRVNLTSAIVSYLDGSGQRTLSLQ